MTVHFTEQVYKLEKSADDWNLYVGGSARPCGMGNDGGPSYDPMRHEYLRAILDPQNYHSCPRAHAAILDEGGEHDAPNGPETIYFQVVGVYHGASRPKVVRTEFEDATTIAQNASMAITVDYMAIWRRSEHAVVAYFDSDPITLNVLDLAPGVQKYQT